MIYEKLFNIQQELKATKDLYNAFGKYKYRSCESIIESLKPLLKANNCVAIFNDEIVEIGGRNYIKSTLKFIDVSTGESVETVACAREDDNKKGMDASQMTGTSSSYARKYALNALFCIDDNKDSDATNNTPKEEPPKQYERKSEPTPEVNPQLTKNEFIELKEIDNCVDWRGKALSLWSDKGYVDKDLPLYFKVGKDTSGKEWKKIYESILIDDIGLLV